ncbi:MAG: hypothetical protein A2Y73_00465 [Chloroflexi bacterium RBG_13_56_8]|nr:MAG: hypothetical protein A2Y73_00465 [Chloroflexi bacterium RBG_13_56_8]
MYKRGVRWLLILLLPAILVACQYQDSEAQFSGSRALAHVEEQCAFGPRPVGSEANAKTAAYIEKVLRTSGWEVEKQEFAHQGLQVRNVIGKKGQGPIILLGAHYDTRPLSDMDPTDRSKPVMGANDGGSGVAVLLELARVLDKAATGQAQVWLAFFDAEDRGELGGWDWSVGAQYMANRLDARPEYVLVVDMVGDTDQRIYYEWASSLWLQERIWGIATDLGYGEHFIPTHCCSIVDDHRPFLQQSIPAALIIDLDYPYWHTTHDTPDKVSAESLQRVGSVLETLLEKEPFARSLNEG